jgi:hypothetical protein
MLSDTSTTRWHSSFRSFDNVCTSFPGAGACARSLAILIVIQNPAAGNHRRQKIILDFLKKVVDKLGGRVYNNQAVGRQRKTKRNTDD